MREKFIGTTCSFLNEIFSLLQNAEDNDNFRAKPEFAYSCLFHAEKNSDVR